MDQQAATLLNTLKRPAVNSDQKINALNGLKSDIKHYRVPESAQATIFECLKIAITQQASSQLVASAFSTLGHLIKRLSIQDASGHAIQQLAPRLFGALQDRLGDLREPIRSNASQVLCELYPYLGADVERVVRDEAMTGNSARAKETAMHWVVRMHRDENMPFKSYVGPIVANLEDSDGAVREAAKNALVELFGNASSGAKADLKKQLKAHSVRHSIASSILAAIDGGTSGSQPSAHHSQGQDVDMTASTRSLPTLDHVAHFAETINSEAAQPPPQETVQMDPIYVHSERELNDAFRDMLPHFEGKETEQNWMPRDKSILKVRRLLKGNAPNEYHHSFMAGIKSLVEGILKVSNSLRTTMSTNGCQLVQELARTLGPALDPHTEILLQSFIKMSSATKHIASENGRHTADAIFHHCSYHVRLMQHIWNAAQDKNASMRQCAPEWLRTILKRQAGYKSHFESSGGLDLAEKSIRKGLDDANPKVKEGMRATYWTFAKAWPEKAEGIMNKLDAKSRTLLEKDPNNPNASLHASQSSAASGPSSRPAQSGRSTLREMMAEQRRAKSAARNLPERPNSAMATLSPSKPKPELSSASRGPSKLRGETNRAVSNASTATSTSSGGAPTGAKGSSLMSGPVRRPRRPEMQRPQTADPYASKRLLRPETPANGTPSNSPPKGTGTSKASIPTSSASRNRARTAGQALGSREGSPNVRRSPMPSARRVQDESSRPASKDSNATQTQDFSTFKDDDFTMVMPKGISKRTATLAASRPALDKTTSVDSGLPAMAEDDGFTMVMPNLSQSQAGRERSPLNYRSPLKQMIEEARHIGERPGSASSHRRQQSDPFLETGSANGRLSPARRGSPVKSVSPQPAEVQIYEDPVAGEDAEAPTNGERQVLSELPVNENMRAQSPARSIGSSASPAGSPRHVSEAGTSATATSQDRAEVLRNRRLLASGIERIRARTLDAHGFRRVQDLARLPHQDIWGDSGAKYDELMSALLDYLCSFATDAKLSQLPAAKSAGLKAQALGVLRALLTLQRKSAGSWYSRALVAVLVCRRTVDHSSHITADLERTATEIIKLAAPETCIDAVLDHLSAPQDTPSPRATAMALTTLRALILSARQGKNKTELDDTRKFRLAHTAAEHLEDSDAEVRKADVEFACEVFALYGSEAKTGFWGEFKGVEEGRLGLLTYYIAKRERDAAGVA